MLLPVLEPHPILLPTAPKPPPPCPMPRPEEGGMAEAGLPSRVVRGEELQDWPRIFSLRSKKWHDGTWVLWSRVKNGVTPKWVALVNGHMN